MRGRHDDDLVHQLEVLHRDDVLAGLKYLRMMMIERGDHREAAEHGAGDEVRRGRSSCASRGSTDTAKSNDTTELHREDQRRREAGEEQVGLLVVAARRGCCPSSPGSGCRRPACGRGAGPRSRAAARSGIRPVVPEHDRHERVGGDREHVPEERRAEVHPRWLFGVWAAAAASRPRATAGPCGPAGTAARTITARRSSSPRRSARSPVRHFCRSR